MKKFFRILVSVFVVMVLLSEINTNEIVAADNETKVRFYESFVEAKDAASLTGKPIVIEFYDKGTSSKKLNSIVMADKRVIELFANDMILVKVEGYVNKELEASRYDVKVLPTIIVTNSDGKEYDRIVGYVEANDFIKQVTDFTKGVGTLDDLIEKANVTKDRSLYFKIFKKYFVRQNKIEAMKWINKVIDEGSPTDSLSGRARFTLADMLKISRDLNGALAAYREIKIDFKGTALEELASINIPYIAMNNADTATAIIEFKKFIAEFPNSDKIEYAKKTLEELTK